VRDVADCIAGARFLVERGDVDGARLLIRGGSAGGYTTLCALTFHDVFRAGTSHYGIGVLEALARDTHKFESRYDQRLIGPYPERRDLYVARSPIHHVDRLNCPIIFFQGLEDSGGGDGRVSQVWIGGKQLLEEVAFMAEIQTRYGTNVS
jgi:dipeptidyl aminopeptidase/acylaminoacyl peptidase